MNKKKLNKVRKKLDTLDHKLLSLIKKRTILVEKVIKIKRYKKQIVDKKRINEILKKIKIKSIQNKIDPKIPTRIWKSMIWSYVEYQRKNFKKT